MIIAFSGSRSGLYQHQLTALHYHLSNQPLSVFKSNEFHHGCATGSDESAHRLVKVMKKMGLPITIHGHPSDITVHRAEGVVHDVDVLHPIKAPLDRNNDIIKDADLVIAAPITPVYSRSGTWSLVRRAQHKGIPIILIPRESIPVINLRGVAASTAQIESEVSEGVDK